MDFKQAIIENAWGGFNMDYGLLHLQLATPLTVLAFILMMIFLLNKLFSNQFSALWIRGKKISREV